MLATLYGVLMAGRLVPTLLTALATLLLLLLTTTAGFILRVLAALLLSFMAGLVVRAIVMFLCHKYISCTSVESRFTFRWHTICRQEYP